VGLVEWRKFVGPRVRKKGKERKEGFWPKGVDGWFSIYKR